MRSRASSSDKTLVPSISGATTRVFSNHSTNSERLLLDSFRKRESFEQMRTALENNPQYKERKEDVFIFPDERDYRSHITDVLATPLVTELSLTRDGKTYNIDEH